MPKILSNYILYSISHYIIRPVKLLDKKFKSLDITLNIYDNPNAYDYINAFLGGFNYIYSYNNCLKFEQICYSKKNKISEFMYQQTNCSDDILIRYLRRFNKTALYANRLLSNPSIYAYKYMIKCNIKIDDMFSLFNNPSTKLIKYHIKKYGTYQIKKYLANSCKFYQKWNIEFYKKIVKKDINMAKIEKNSGYYKYIDYDKSIDIFEHEYIFANPNYINKIKKIKDTKKISPYIWSNPLIFVTHNKLTNMNYKLFDNLSHKLF